MIEELPIQDLKNLERIYSAWLRRGYLGTDSTGNTAVKLANIRHVLKKRLE